ncbi:hypothetical protein [Daejeonella oryzae]|uniref:hypothetical protein n=1 Tax=Daejeonella oryzae TaxID=1122943 RepID=UPI000404D38A|nr:hypothetical protein [Daejeonella oryzae]
MAALSNTRFTLLALPQGVDAEGNLSVNIIWIPRNISPLEPVSTIFAGGVPAQAFADTQPQFNVIIVNDAAEFAGKNPANERAVLTALEYSNQIRAIYETLKNVTNEDGSPKYFDIDESRNADVSTEHTAPPAEEKSLSVKKYLPHSYRDAFNFTSPRTKNAVTDDSYHCAIRDAEPNLNLIKETKVSWGKVYAYLLRQPLMAQKAGLLYKTSISLTDADFSKGGWVYIDVVPDTVYSAQQTDSMIGDEPFIKRYAARIPILKKDADGKFIPRTLFAPVLFPVLKVGGTPDGIFDEVFIEASQYNDGFSKIVHANQPMSGNILKEEPDGFHPQKEMGIRLGWDDEQILIWYLRQLAKDESVTNQAGRLDSPLGVAGFHIDVKLDEEGAEWESLTAVESLGDMMLEDINIGSYTGELPFQVYPTKLYGVNSSNYWLPMFFSNWNDCSLVIPDKTAAELYQNSRAVQKKPDGTVEDRQVNVSNTYKADPLNTRLRYGNSYFFRIRLADISGGGPKVGEEAINPGPGGIAKSDFKRYVAPSTLRLSENENLKHTTDDLNFTGETLVIKRPVLEYPTVVYTNKYDDAVALLKSQLDQNLALEAAGTFINYSIGLSDPDVKKVEIKVEVETLQMDNLLSESGKDNYITLFTTNRNFDADNFEQELDINFQYKDFNVLNLADQQSPFDNEPDNLSISQTDGNIILPTERNLRITLRAVCDDQENYWGNINSNPNLDSRYGKTTVLKMRKASENELDLFTGMNDARVLQGIFLQPDPQPVYDSNKKTQVAYSNTNTLPDIAQRLAKQLDLAVNGLSLSSENGMRIHFWCSNLIRHTLAPDGSSVTFSSKSELIDRWLVVTSLYVNRDWTWDGLNPSSFSVLRRRKFGSNAVELADMEYQFIGDLELYKIASFQAIQEGEDGLIHREYSRIIFIDILDAHTVNNDFPDTLEVQYKIVPEFLEEGLLNVAAPFESQQLLLPVTVNPKQLPKIIGAGIALSPYIRNKKYSATEARKRFLWLEFDQLPEDKNDELFARPLAYATDQLISNNHPSLFEIPKEPPLPIDPEYIRVIVPSSAHEHSGLKAMQKLEKSIDQDRHFYLLPLPPALHHESSELFGFYTYEFRFGHTDRIWSTAQGRFGRAFRLTGLQHPAPNLICNVTRDEIQLTLSAPFATAVMKGKNVTANPPRTTIWCLLYAQVQQADGLDFRNILIAEQRLQQRPVEFKIRRQYERLVTDPELSDFEKHIAINQIQNINVALEKESKQIAETVWLNSEIKNRLRLYGLPEDCSLSVLCVEFFGNINSIYDQISDLPTNREELINNIAVHFDKDAAFKMNHDLPSGSGLEGNNKEMLNKRREEIDQQNPVTSDLGKFRILRTSPLTEVPFVCCTEDA